MTPLSIDALTVRFGGLVAVDSVTLSLAPKEVVGLVGPNGAGKSTLLAAVAGAVPPTKGDVKLNGRSISAKDTATRARLGLVRTFQHPALFDSLTVEENLRAVHGGRRAGTRSAGRIAAILELLGLSSVADVRTSELPYGLKRLVDIGRALALNPQVLLLDEPAAGLNTSEKQRLRDVLAEAQSTMGWAALVVEHDIGFVSDLATRVVVLNFGAVIADSSPAEVWRNEKVIEAYLGPAHA